MSGVGLTIFGGGGFTQDQIEGFFDTSGVPADHSITELQVAAANIDGAPQVPSMVTRNTGSVFAKDAADWQTPSRKALEADLLTLAGRYRTLVSTSARGLTVAAAAGTKYIAAAGNQDLTTYNPGATNALFVRIAAADMAITGLTTKLRLVGAIETVATAPGVTVTPALYSLTSGSGGTLALNAPVAGSTVELKELAKEKVATFAGVDFDPPADGLYAIGYTVSGVPAGLGAFPSLILQAHSV